MNKNIKGLIVVSILAALGYAGWKLLNPGKKKQVSYLISKNYSTGSPQQLMELGDDFIKAWYQAAKAGQSKFELAGISYNIHGGKKL